MRAGLGVALACFASSWAYCAEPIEDKTPRAEAIKANFDKLVSEDKAVKREALLYFGKVDKTFAAEVPLFTASLKDKRNQVRAISAYALGEIGRAAAGSIPEVEKLLTDSSATVQKYAGRALERLVPFKLDPKKPTPEGVAEARISYRKWTSSDGKHSEVAKLLGVDPDGLVILTRKDGKSERIPFREFSKADQGYLKSTDDYKDYLKSRSEAKKESGATKPTPPEVIDAIKKTKKGVTLKFDKNKAVVSVDLRGARVTDAGLAHLKGLTNLEHLLLDYNRITDAGLVHLKGLTSLGRLCLNRTNVTDAGLVHLKGLTKLKWLDLYKTRVTDSGLVHLKGLTKLEWLYLRDTQVTDAGVKQLQQALPNCRIVR